MASRLYVAQGLINFTQDFTVQMVDLHLHGELGAIGLGICDLHMSNTSGNGAACQSAIRVLGPERLLASRKCPLCFSAYMCSFMGSRTEQTPSSGSLAVHCLLAQGFTTVLNSLWRAFSQVTMLTQILHYLQAPHA